MPLGTGASPGIAMGKAFVIENEPLKVEKTNIESIEKEIEILLSALAESKIELEKIKEKAYAELGEDKALIFEAHIMILDDVELLESTSKKIKGNINASYALKETADEFIAIFEAMENEYMRERAVDIKDVTDRVLRKITGQSITDLAVLEEEVILIANDLTPSDTAIMDKSKVLGLLTNIGGRTSHTAIMARSLEIPAIVGLKNITKTVKDNDFIIFDGDKGIVEINPSEETLIKYKEMKVAYERGIKELEEMKGKESITYDKRKVELAGNIGTPDDVPGLLRNDAEGVGLYRTEFIYMNRETMPSEEEQYISYKKVLEAMGSKPVIIRTLDIGGDKKLPYLDIGEELNPFLGYRAIRLCLREPEIFKIQLRALLRASIFGNLKIMFPMISSLEELLEAKAILNEVKEKLTKENIDFSKDVEVGIMIEVPSAAIISDILAEHVDFFSIGTNDLIQYTCAVDRMNEKIEHLYQPFNPGVLRLIKTVIENGHRKAIWVGMCGEVAGDMRLIPLLIGMGLDEFSMSPISILHARRLIRSLSYEKCKKIANEALALGSAKEIEGFMEKMNSNLN